MRKWKKDLKFERTWKALGLLTALWAFTTFVPHEEIRSTAAIPRPSTISKEILAPKLKNWGIYNPGNSHIQAMEAWDLEKGSRKVVVAVIDTGIDPGHRDLKKNIWHSPSGKMVNCSSTYGLQPITRAPQAKLPFKRKQLTSKNAKRIIEKATAEVYGWDYVNNSPNPIDLHGHGTHVSGIIGAIANPEQGVSGVVQEISIMPIKFYSQSNSGLTNLQNTVRAIHCAVENGARIINYSGGGPEYSEEEYRAIKKAEDRGVLIVAAAGNEHRNIEVEANKYYPASYPNVTNVISVTALDIDNHILSSSNFGRNVDVAAPGEDIYSTLPGNRYGKMTGTSQATAFVTGVAALLLSHNPNLTPDQIRKIIRASAVPVAGLSDKVGSGGRISAYRALELLIHGNLPDARPATDILATRPREAQPLMKFPSVDRWDTLQ